MCVRETFTILITQNECCSLFLFLFLFLVVGKEKGVLSGGVTKLNGNAT